VPLTLRCFSQSLRALSRACSSSSAARTDLQDHDSQQSTGHARYSYRQNCRLRTTLACRDMEHQLLHAPGHLLLYTHLLCSGQILQCHLAIQCHMGVAARTHLAVQLCPVLVVSGLPTRWVKPVGDHISHVVSNKSCPDGSCVFCKLTCRCFANSHAGVRQQQYPTNTVSRRASAAVLQNYPLCQPLHFNCPGRASRRTSVTTVNSESRGGNNLLGELVSQGHLDGRQCYEGVKLLLLLHLR
jgi:hypothetical protein